MPLRNATSLNVSCYPIARRSGFFRKRSAATGPLEPLQMIRLVTLTRFACFAFLVMVATSIHARAQHDSRGLVFWVTFMENYGSGLPQSDLRLYLAADTPTTARIVYFGSMDTIA